MKSKIAFVAGAGIGYVFGTRAGRQQFEKFKGRALEVWNSDSVQNTVSDLQDKATEVAKSQGSALKEKVEEVVKNVKGSSEEDSGTAPKPTDPGISI